MPRKYEPQDRRIGAPDYDDYLSHQYDGCPEQVRGPGPIPWLVAGIIIGAILWWFIAPAIASGVMSTINGCEQYRSEIVACAEGVR